MTPVWLIAINFMREQRWFITLMLLYIAGVTMLMVIAGHDPETLLILKQEALYGIFFAVVIAVAFFQNERKTRRIIAVLSKAVSRRQYVAGAILGVNLTTLMFYAGVSISLFVLYPGARVGGAAQFLAHLVVACLLASVVTVFYSTFLHPLVATLAAGLTLVAPMIAERIGGPHWAVVLPVYALLRSALRYRPEAPFAAEPGVLLLAALECVVLWIFASWIFALRDITTPVE
jgi:ABC-type transport system involved in multi-copper enzyme maturation permease subunit